MYISKEITTFAHKLQNTKNTPIDIFTQSPSDYAKKIALQVKQRRLDMHLTQAGLALRADIPLTTYKYFERTGKTSLQNLLKIAFALNCLDDFNLLFAQPKWNTLDEMLQKKQSTKKRGNKNK